MTLKTLTAVFAILLGATAAGFAQSLPYYGPNAPANADTFGKPPSGTRPPGVTRSHHSSYPKRVYPRYHRYNYVRYE